MKTTKSANVDENPSMQVGYVGIATTNGPVLLSGTYESGYLVSWSGSGWVSTRPVEKERPNSRQSVRTGVSGVRNTHSRREVWEAFSQSEQEFIRELSEVFGAKFLQGEVSAERVGEPTSAERVGEPTNA